MSPEPMPYEGLTIRALGGPEPARDGEYPWAVDVGKPFNGEVVARIEHRIDDRGDCGVGWFDVFSDTHLLASFNERYVAEVLYLFHF